MNKQSIMFDSEITAKSVAELIYDINQLNPFNEDTTPIELTIYFTTTGGVVSHGFIIVDYLLRMAKAGNIINFIVTDVCYSTGLFILAGLQNAAIEHNCQNNVKFKFFKYARGLFHEISVSLHTREDKPQIKEAMVELSQRSEIALKLFKKYMSKQEISSFKNGGDVYFDYIKLSKIFNGEIINII